MATFANRAALALLTLSLGACAGGGSSPITFTDDRGVADQPFPSSHRTEVLAAMRTYLNNPQGIHDAAMAEPAQRTVGGRLRYVSCLRYNPREADGSYRGVRERGVLFVDGRLDRIIENSAEVCAGASYAPFPELERMTR